MCIGKKVFRSCLDKLVKLLVFLVVFLAVASCRAQKISFDSSLISAYVDRLVDEWNIAGCAVGIVYKDSLIFSGGYGYRNYKNKRPVTDKTLFALGSNTKLFTAIAASMAHVEGKLDLDVPVNRYMPDLAFPTNEIKEKVTLRDMLSHTTGVPRYDGVWFGAKYNDTELIDRLRYLTPTQTFRNAFLYNNIYFSLAGMIVGQQYGTKWQQLIHERIFSPLEMKHSGFEIGNPSEEKELGSDYIYDANTNTLKQLTNADYFCRCIEPSGLVVSNVQDLSHWVTALLNGGVFKGVQAIPAAAIDGTARINNKFYRRFNHEEIRDSAYGLGRAIASYKNRRFLYHGGSAGGYRTEISLFPNDSLGIIVLTNTVQGAGMSVAAVFGIADILFDLEKTNWSERLLSEQRVVEYSRKKDLDSILKSRKAAVMRRDPLKRYAGIYYSEIYGNMSIRVKNGKLNMRFRDVEERLEQIAEDEFWTKEHSLYVVYPQLYPVYKLKFLRNRVGKIDRIQTSIINDPTTEFLKTVQNR
jgi:CubicO group peptidase (beta-lactamase class C family)